jgi:peptide deformylase
VDENFEPHDEWFDGFEARVIQHEFDHLEGKMFVDYLSPLRKQLVKKKLVGMTKGQFSCTYKAKPNR